MNPLLLPWLPCAVLVMALPSSGQHDHRPCHRPNPVLAVTEHNVSGYEPSTAPGGSAAGTDGDRQTVALIGSNDEGRGKKEKKAKKTFMNMMVGGSVMTAFVVIIMFLNVITVTLGKAFLFVFISKFLAVVNLFPSGSSSSSSKKKPGRKDVTVVLGGHA